MNYLKSWLGAGAVLIGAVLCALICIEQDRIVQFHVGSFIRSLLERSLKTPISLRCSSIRFLSGRIMVENVCARDVHDGWQWKIGAMELRFSPLRLLRERKLYITCILHSVNASSGIANGTVALMPHILQLLSAAAGNTTVIVEKVVFADGTLTVVDKGRRFTCEISGDVPVTDTGGTIRLWWDHGSLYCNDTHVLESCSGWYHYHKKQKQTMCEAVVDCLNEQHSDERVGIHIAGQNGIWTIQAGTPTDSMHAELVFDRQKDLFQGALTAQIGFVQRYMPASYRLFEGGSVHISVESLWSQLFSDMSLTYTIKDTALSHIDITVLQGFAHYTQDRCSAQTDIVLQKYGTVSLQGNMIAHAILFNVTHTGLLPTVMGMTLQPGSVQASGKIMQDGLWSGQYSLQVMNTHGVASPVKGTFHGDTTMAVVEGISGNYRCSGAVELHPQMRLRNLTLHKNDAPWIGLTTTREGVIAGSIDYALLATCAELQGYSVPGEGTLLLEAVVNNNKIMCDLRLQDATIRLPYTYNIVEDFSAHILYDLRTSMVQVTDLLVTLHKGSLAISEMKCMLRNGTVAYAHIPCQFRDCLLSCGKDIFATFSGTMDYIYQNDQPSYLRGCFLLDRAHIRTNIFSTELQRQLMPTTTRPAAGNAHYICDMHVFTRSPFKVQTSFLEATAHAHVQLQGDLRKPLIRARIDHMQGSLLFPHKPLFIQQGTVVWLPEHSDDPALSMSAENTIKGYRIRMNVDGSARAPRISFHATPHLPEEQIIGLLWGGSEDGSLYLAMSTSIMQSLEQLIVGPAEYSSRALQSLKNLFKPLGSVRFVPGVTDQSGRGGLRGSLAIEVNDRLRGIIKQNFDLPQDVMLEVEYALSDEARVRAFRDERGDLGAELEASWKF